MNRMDLDCPPDNTHSTQCVMSLIPSYEDRAPEAVRPRTDDHGALDTVPVVSRGMQPTDGGHDVEMSENRKRTMGVPVGDMEKSAYNHADPDFVTIWSSLSVLQHRVRVGRPRRLFSCDGGMYIRTST